MDCFIYADMMTEKTRGRKRCLRWKIYIWLYHMPNDFTL